VQPSPRKLKPGEVPTAGHDSQVHLGFRQALLTFKVQDLQVLIVNNNKL